MMNKMGINIDVNKFKFKFKFKFFRKWKSIGNVVQICKIHEYKRKS